MAQSATGRMVAVWMGFLDDTATFAATIEYAISDDGGKTWSKPSSVGIAPEVTVLNDPALAVDANGNFILAALGFNIPGVRRHSGVYVYTLPTGSQTFGPAISVDQLDPTNDLFYFDRPEIAVTRSGYVVTYLLMGRGDASNPIDSHGGVAATSTDGAHWQHDTITKDVFSGMTICSSGQSILTFYSSRLGGVWAAASADGRNWQAPQSLDATATNAGTPSCASRGNDVWAVYANSPSAARLAHSVDAGAHFTSAPLAVNGSVSMPTIAARADGTLDVAYYTSNSSVAFGFARGLFMPGSSTFQTIETIRTGLRTAPDRQGRTGLLDFVGMVPGGIVFTDNSTGTSHIVFARFAL